VVQVIGSGKACVEPRVSRVVGWGAHSQTGRDLQLQQIVTAALGLSELSFAAIRMTNANGYWLAAEAGLDAVNLRRVRSFCARALARREPMMVWDTQADARFALSPLVLSKPGIRFYASVPLFDAAGYNVAALCVGGANARTNFSQIHDLVRLAHRAERYVGH